MKRERPSISTALVRCLRLRCPACGKSSIIQRPFQIKHHCGSCDTLFEREEGFFVGAIMVNVIITEFVILALYFISLLLIGSHFQLILTLLLIVAILFPIAFYHYSWSVWLSFDHLVETLPRYVRDGSSAQLEGEGEGGGRQRQTGSSRSERTP